ncbi:MAG: macro domain-containing protein [Chloroflexota bacterium]
MREVVVGTGRLQVRRGDITSLGRHVGAIVNAANRSLSPGGGVCGAIHTFGGPAIATECALLGPIETGMAAITTAGRLDADAVIHAVGPVWEGGEADEDRFLAAAYRCSLQLAATHGLRSIAFPSISTGIYGFPVERAAMIAIGTVAAFLKRESGVDEVLLVQFSEGDAVVYESALDRWELMQAARSSQGAG